jgi:hypothetical protein
MGQWEPERSKRGAGTNGVLKAQQGSAVSGKPAQREIKTYQRMAIRSGKQLNRSIKQNLKHEEAKQEQMEQGRWQTGPQCSDERQHVAPLEPQRAQAETTEKKTMNRKKGIDRQTEGGVGERGGSAGHRHRKD